MPDLNSFDKTIDNLIDLYQKIKIPAIILDENLQTVWCNSSAKKKMPFLCTHGGFPLMLSEKNRGKISLWMADVKKQENHLRIKQSATNGDMIFLSFTLFGSIYSRIVLLCTAENASNNPIEQSGERTDEKKAFFDIIKELDYNIREPLFSSFSAIDSAKIVIKDLMAMYSEIYDNIQDDPPDENTIMKNETSEKEMVLNLYLDSIYLSNYKILKLCINLSKFNRLQHPEYSNDEENFDIVCLNDLLNEVCHVIHVTTQEYGTPFFYNIPTKKMIAKINVDDFLLTIFNILSNAFLYEKLKGKNSVSLTLTKKDNFAEIKISDQGLGISEEKITKLLSPFYKKNEKDSLSNGIGLGIPVSKLCVENMNGFFEIESKEGMGTTVSIKLPIKSQIKTDILTMKQESEETFIKNKYSYLYVILAEITKMPMGG